MQSYSLKDPKSEVDNLLDFIELFKFPFQHSDPYSESRVLETVVVISEKVWILRNEFV